jgi:PadR family transcriptional regulator, regulatory protein PadR
MALGDLEQLVLLAILHLGDDAYGVTIAGVLRDKAGRDLAMATVYTTLERLEAKRYLDSRLGDPTAARGGKRKRFFRVNAAGERAVRESLSALNALTAGLGRRFQS